MSSEQLRKPVLHLIPGVSGSGKTTTGRYAVERINSSGLAVAKLVVPHTTRPPRSHETEGIDYNFHTPADYEATYRSLCETGQDGWAVSKIGSYHYFNTTDATKPTKDVPVSVLPVAFNALDEVVAEHATDEYDVQVLPIAISPSIREQWLTVAQTQRPGRDLERELDEQDAFLGSFNGDIFYPQWNGTSDLERYFEKMQRSMAAARVITNLIVEIDTPYDK